MILLLESTRFYQREILSLENYVPRYNQYLHPRGTEFGQGESIGATGEGFDASDPQATLRHASLQIADDGGGCLFTMQG